MSDGQNLWIGLLLGMLLTGLLMFVLHQQADLTKVAEQQPTKTITHTQVFKPLATDSANTTVNQALLSQQERATINVSSSTASDQAKAEVQKPDTVLTLPKGLDLSPKELQALSEAEQAEYQALLMSYREVRTHVLNLQQEREQLKQRMDKMFERNEVMELELDKMREAVRIQSQALQE